jgi:hypothetical protein
MMMMMKRMIASRITWKNHVVVGTTITAVEEEAGKHRPN